MEKRISGRVFGIAWLCTLVYFASYLMRNNFAVMLVKVCAEMGVAKSALAVVITGMTIFYGTGQIVNGIVGDRISPRLMLSGGLLLAAACNVVMFFATSIPLMTVVWCINGFAHAMLWPPIVRILSTNLNDEEYNYAAVRVSWGSSFATIAMYLLCPLLLKVMTWRWIIFSFAMVGIGIAAVWIILSPRFLSEERVTELAPAVKAESTVVHRPLPKFVFLPLVLIMFGIVFQGMLRDGVTNWMPSFLTESFGLSEENSILVTVVQAVFSLFAYSLASVLHQKFFKNEVTCAGALFALSVLCGVALYVCSLFGANVIVSTLLMALIIAGMHSVNLMLITIVPKRFAKSGKVSTFSGILNACTYIGAAISTYGFAALAESYGWNFTILSWAVIAAAGAVVCMLAMPIWRRFRREYVDQ